MITIKYSTSSDLSSPVTTAGVAVASDTDYAGKVDIPGLAANTQYWYTPVLDGVDQYTAPYPTFKTFPESGQPLVLKFVFGSCTYQGGSDSLFDAAPSDAAFLMHLGDTAYQGSNTTLAQFRALQQQHLVGVGSAFSHFKDLRARTPVFSMWDDNDRGSGGSPDPTATNAAALQAFQEYTGMSNPDSPTDGALYYSFHVGNVGFFVPDERQYESSSAANDDSSKVMLGATQIALLEQWLLDNNDAYPIKFICSETPASGYGTTGADSWGGTNVNDSQLPHYADGYRYERNGLWDFIDQNQITGVVFLAGDNHWAGAFKSIYGQNVQRPRYEFMACPFNATPYIPNALAPDPTNGPILWSVGSINNMGVVTVDTTASPPTVEVQLFGVSGSLGSDYYTKITQDDIDLDLINTPTPAITTTFTLPQPIAGSVYAGSITATLTGGATGAITFSVDSLPSGLSLGTVTVDGDNYTQPIIGTPSTVQTVSSTFTATNGTQTASLEHDFVVADGGSLSVLEAVTDNPTGVVTSGGAFSVTLTDVKAGDQIIAVISSSGQTTAFSFSDAQGNDYLTTSSEFVSVFAQQAAYATASADADTLVVSVSPNATVRGLLTVYHTRGETLALDSANVVINTTPSVVAGTTGLVAGPFNTSGRALVIVSATVYASGTPTATLAGTGYTTDDSEVFNATTSQAALVAHKITSAAVSAETVKTTTTASTSSRFCTSIYPFTF